MPDRARRAKPVRFPERLTVSLPPGTLERVGRAADADAETLTEWGRRHLLRALAAYDRRQGRAVVDAAHEGRS